jgi:hypothetical protein
MRPRLLGAVLAAVFSAIVALGAHGDLVVDAGGTQPQGKLDSGWDLIRASSASDSGWDVIRASSASDSGWDIVKAGAQS